MEDVIPGDYEGRSFRAPAEPDVFEVGGVRMVAVRVRVGPEPDVEPEDEEGW